MKNIGVVGKGFVGSAVAHGFSPAVGYNASVLVYDKDPLKSVNTLDEVVNNSEFIFVSVPTPSNKDGSINLDILFACISEIENAIKDNNPIVLVRSTVVPGTCEEIQKKFPKLRIVFNPEFLTERSATFDFLSQTRYILGGKESDTSEVAALYKDRFGESIAIIETNFQTAELIKYVCNIYFATKVSFLNEMKLISDSIDADWEKVIEGFVRDGRVGSSHTNVPGHDGKHGFGGSCFPKDIQALINFAENNNLDLNVVKGAWKTNLEVRPEKDWEKLKGRAVID
ncbi:MAG: hypothetical protein ACJ0F8_01245 [Gammaproteobacteria bacterium]|uniref:UDP-glucose 6-dehydrogenase n=1 Tax=SAR86 cluster bacterium TaxID=2030880 RepID=A0A520MZF8_9GAMM|nr:UDP-glucose/GDP-mannose dehydrogenase family protein [SAR86 cluster bacterium]RZO26601.1 MAG: UDP-glucose/GDP-mannose dehydrogenase family protein [SAR86 cluster bacterium]|tara:strand:+ start:1817 stop:2668 length:852 start_codon:yes stop_codon:yes gene_type:complete